MSRQAGDLRAYVREGEVQSIPTQSVSGPFFESILAMRVHEPWMDESLCQQTDPEVFFPEDGTRPAAAKTICGLCDVRAECLKYAMSFGYREDVGFWGGTNERERKVLRAARRKGIAFDYQNPDVKAVGLLIGDEDLDAD